MKAVVVIDIDDNEDIRHYGVCVYHYTSRQFVHINTPLKPLPQKKNGDDLYERYGSWTLSDEKEASYRAGFNDCLDEITGEQKYESENLQFYGI